MTVKIDTYLGKVSFTSEKVPGDFDIDAADQLAGQGKGARLKLLLKFFPLEFNEIDEIEFFPKEEKYETPEYRQVLKQYLRDEGFIGGEGNFMIKSFSVQTA